MRTTLVILGSGGHTTEMLAILNGFNSSHYKPIHYVIANTDKMSLNKLKLYHDSTNSGIHDNLSVSFIPRAREVGQSYLSSFFYTAYALAYSYALIWKYVPDIILCNGPGTCIPICIAAFLQRNLYYKYIHIVYIESICRVKSLSLSGKLLYYIAADYFFVQWKNLSDIYTKAIYLDKVI